MSAQDNENFLGRWNPAAAKVLAEREAWYAEAAQDDMFKARGGTVYPYDIIHANVDPLCRLMIDAGFTSELDPDASVVDIGCANGDLSYALALSGFKVSAIDWSYAHDQAPAFVRAVSNRNGFDIAVADLSVDQYFGIEDVRAAAIANADKIPEVYDLAISFGLVYHLKNPFAFFESLSKVTKRLIVGTHVITHEPKLGARIDNYSMAYLVDAYELNSDPTNYWMLTEKAFARLAERSGFTIEARLSIPNNPLGISTPDDTALGVRSFLALKSKHF